MDEHGRALTEGLQFGVCLGLALFSLYAGHVMQWGTP